VVRSKEVGKEEGRMLFLRVAVGVAISQRGVCAAFNVFRCNVPRRQRQRNVGGPVRRGRAGSQTLSCAVPALVM